MKLSLLIMLFLINTFKPARNPKTPAQRKFARDHRRELKEMKKKGMAKSINELMNAKFSKSMMKQFSKKNKKKSNKRRNYHNKFNLDKSYVDYTPKPSALRILQEIHIDREVKTYDYDFKYCDHGTPDVVGDCTKYQTDESSCCYFSYGNEIGCVFLGIRYLGDIEYGGLTLKCASNYMKINLFVLFLILCTIF